MARSITKKNKCSRGHQSPISKKKSHSSTDFGHRNYSLYINRVLKEVVPQRGISSRTVDIMNTLIDDIFERISMEACSLMCFRNRCTLTPEDIQKAVYLLLPGKLAKYAVAFGSEAVQRYVHS
ncbi:histone H2B subacrosomal variant-like [Mirounga angustirostris]|uniref:histone H2B subacrosomal variant-like n=1 Tax=Mirounga leonina TaxID=9715 RepID=UPI00156BE4C8|nr:histone H2B subacrosomal variant-like [Mirounga leonina]XP_045742850.1 histone H2B subacrosomal variant-like [Mirounga angustirostris]